MGEVYSQCSLSDIWTSLISVDRLDLQVVIAYVGVYSKTVCTPAQAARYVRVGVAELHAQVREGL